jgi:hypothetical protein
MSKAQQGKKRSKSQIRPPEPAIQTYDPCELAAEWNSRQVRMDEERRRRLAALQTTQAEPRDRMMRYQRNPCCPNCDAHPVVCMMRWLNYAAFRCRECGHV